MQAQRGRRRGRASGRSGRSAPRQRRRRREGAARRRCRPAGSRRKWRAGFAGPVRAGSAVCGWMGPRRRSRRWASQPAQAAVPCFRSPARRRMNPRPAGRHGPEIVSGWLLKSVPGSADPRPYNASGARYSDMNGLASLAAPVAAGPPPLVHSTSLGSGVQWGHSTDGPAASQYLTHAVRRQTCLALACYCDNRQPGAGLRSLPLAPCSDICLPQRAAPARTCGCCAANRTARAVSCHLS